MSGRDERRNRKAVQKAPPPVPPTGGLSPHSLSYLSQMCVSKQTVEFCLAVHTMTLEEALVVSEI